MVVADRATVSPLQRWQRCLAVHPVQTLRAGGLDWPTVVAGRGERVVVLLPGALGLADTAFKWIEALAPRNTVVSLGIPAGVRCYPVFRTGFLGLLDALRAERVALYGGSFGGEIALALVNDAPARFDTLVLADCRLPDRPMLPIRLIATALDLLPEGAMTLTRRLTTEPVLRSMGEEQPFWRNYFRRAERTVTAADLLDRLWLWVDVNEQPPVSLARWRGRVLLLESTADWFFGERQRRALRNALPGARVVELDGLDHAAAMERPEQHLAEVERFLGGE
ncbi:MAG: alpha/beta hydrolase [Dehalococcoidia bacterium]